MKIDLDGDTIWTSKVEGDSGVFYTDGSKLTNNSYGGLFIACSKVAGSDDVTKGILISTDVNGDTLWIREYDEPGYDILRTVSQVNDSTLFLCGEVTVDSDIDIRLVVTDTLGNLINSFTYGNEYEQDQTSASPTYDDAFIIAGLNDLGFLSNQCYVIKVDLEGNIIWEENYGWNWESGKYILPLPDGSFYLAGSHLEQVGSVQQLQSDLRKIDGNGTIIWEKEYNYGSGNFAMRTNPVVSGSNLYIGGSITSPVNSSREGFIMKLSLDGDSIWMRRYDGNPNFPSYVYDLNKTPDNGFILSGTTFNEGPQVTQDAWLVKLDSMGCLVPGCALSTEQFTEEFGYFEIGPNPAKDQLNIYISELNARDIHINIIDARGRLVLSDQNLDHEITYMLDISNLKSGIYAVQLQLNEKNCSDKEISC